MGADGAAAFGPVIVLRADVRSAEVLCSEGWEDEWPAVMAYLEQRGLRDGGACDHASDWFPHRDGSETFIVRGVMD